MAREPVPIAVIGTGYVGLVTAAGFAELGFPKRCLRAEAACRQLRLPLSAAHFGDRRKRTAEAARDRQAHKHLGSLVDKTVTLLGVAFKAGTDDMREAASLVLAARLQADGARVRAHDPIAEHEACKLMVGVEFGPSALDALEGADACVLVTEWPEAARLDWRAAAQRMVGCTVIDGRNFLDSEAVRQAGFVYEGIGR